MTARLEAVERKLDFIIDELAVQRRQRREMEELKDDLMRVGKDMYQSAVLELEEVHDHIGTGDMLYLGKKLLRNVNNMTRTFEQLENAKDFVQDFGPISRELFRDAMDRLHEFDRKGYFHFLKELSRVADTVVESFTVEDVRHLAENVVTILNTVKNLTQPDMLRALNNAVAVYKNLELDVQKDVSLFALLRELNSPEAKRGLAFAVGFLKNIARTEP